MDMADDPVLADLQRLMEEPPNSVASDPLAELEALVKDHEERTNASLQEYNEKRAALEAQVAARHGQNDQAAREAEIQRIKEGLQPAA